jgi:hypothetical protein
MTMVTMTMTINYDDDDAGDDGGGDDDDDDRDARD